MKASQDQLEIARTLSEALEPLVDLCLHLGVTSPELESLVRSTFVQRASSRLPRDSRTGKTASDNRVSLATGVHRTEVRQIRAAGATGGAKATMEQKQRLYSKSSRILVGWSTDPRFLNSGGFPLDLLVEPHGKGRSFPDLVAKFAPGVHAGSILKELKRRRCVEIVDDAIVRFRSLTPRTVGINKTNVALASRRLHQLGDTLFQSILNPQRARVYAETKAVEVNADQLPLIQAVLERRAKVFVDSVENEVRGRSEAALHSELKRIGIAVYSWEQSAD